MIPLGTTLVLLFGMFVLGYYWGSRRAFLETRKFYKELYRKESDSN